MPLEQGHQFSERPFVLGSLVGLRHVTPDTDEEGLYLRGPHAGYRYRPGTNIAGCDLNAKARWERQKKEWDERERARAKGEHQREFTPSRSPGISVTRSDIERFTRAAQDDKLDEGLRILNRHFARHFAGMTGNDDLIIVRQPLVPYEPKPFPDPEPEDGTHRAGSTECTCGFYAYFEIGSGSLQFRYGGNMTSIVEGFGLTVVGTRGFRCEKLRLLALVKSPDCFDANTNLTAESLLTQVKRNVEQVEIAKYYGVPLFDNVGQALAEYPLTKPEDA